MSNNTLYTLLHTYTTILWNSKEIQNEDRPKKLAFGEKAQINYWDTLFQINKSKWVQRKLEAYISLKLIQYKIQKSIIYEYLGIFLYYRKFGRDFSKIAAPLYHLTNKDKKWIWREDCEIANK